VWLTKSPFRIGRDNDNDLVLSNDRAISRHHAVLEQTPAYWTVRDLRSLNHTYVNGLVVQSVATPLRADDLIAIGAVTLRLLVGVSADPASATLTPDDVGDPFGLTPREHVLLRHLAAGLTDKQIAQQLGISDSTVRSHLDRIRSKTGRSRRADLTRLAYEIGSAP
jgi:DNA-binding CsgD family transcriptional regulator